MRLWTVNLDDEDAGRMTITGIATSAAKAQAGACKVAKHEYQAKAPEIMGVERGDLIEFGLPK